MVKFYLRNKHSLQTTAIIMIVYYENNRVKISTGCSIQPKFWQEKKQRAKVSLENPNGKEINDRLDSLVQVMTSLLKKYSDENYFPNPDKIKSDLLNQKDVPIKTKKSKTFWDHFEDFILDKQKINPDVRDYNNSLRKHLKRVESIIKCPLNFAVISNDSSGFQEEWSNYLSFVAINSEGDSGLMPNTIGKQNKNLKAFFNWCFDKNITTKFCTKLYPTIMEDVDKIYLTEDDLVKLEKLSISDSIEDIVRDLFLIGCETGLRFSDFTRINSHDINGNELHIVPSKTKNAGVKKLIIPLSNRVQTILNKYNGNLPQFDKNQLTKFNKIIRLLCEKANIKEEIKFYREIAGNVQKISKYKYEEVSSHTCRRTFCTLKFLKGMPAQAIMKFSGHKSERNFLKYLKLDAELTAKKYADFF